MKYNLISSSKLADAKGVQMLLYGPPGGGKTPCVATCPRPVLLSVEQGTRSLHGTNFASFKTRDPKEIYDFITWALESNEAKNFDTLAIDSASDIADIKLEESMKKKKDGRAAYGDMADYMKDITKKLICTQNKHLYVIAKMGMRSEAESGKRIPFFPGKELNTYIPHEFDEIYFASKQIVPGVSLTPVVCWQTFEDNITQGRSRSGLVNPYEPPDFGAIVNKVMKGRHV